MYLEMVLVHILVVSKSIFVKSYNKYRLLKHIASLCINYRYTNFVILRVRRCTWNFIRENTVHRLALVC